MLYRHCFISRTVTRRSTEIAFANTLRSSILFIHFCLWSDGGKLDSTNTDIYNEKQVKGLERLDWLGRVVHQSTTNELIIASLSAQSTAALLLESSQFASIPSDLTNSSSRVQIMRITRKRGREKESSLYLLRNWRDIDECANILR